MVDQKNEKTDKPNNRIGYGVKIPKLTLEGAVILLKATVNRAGEVSSLDTVAEVMGLSRSSSGFHMKLAALKNFGIIVADKTGYSLTDIGRRIVSPESIDDEHVAIQEAFNKNDNLARVWNYYKGKVLPQKEYIANYIEKALDIPSSLKLEWAEYFFECAKFAGVINQREGGVFQVYSSYVPRGDSSKKEKPVESPNKVEQFAPLQTRTFEQFFEGLSGGLFYQKKISNDRKAMIYIPEDLTESDILMIRSIIKSVDAGLDGLKKQDEPTQ